MSQSVRVQVPAKLNLSLAVGPPRPDGFHPLATVYQALSLCDLLEVTDRADGEGVRLHVNAAGVPSDQRNLAWQAAEEAAAAFGREPDVTIRIDKRIPVAGGMAGGSADAAAVLHACSVLWRDEVREPQVDLMVLAAGLGSDVPFALLGGTALGTGRGEVVVPAISRGEFHWVLALSDRALATPSVYAKFDQLNPGAPSPEVDRGVLRALGSGDAAALGRALSNDLQAAAVALVPALGPLLELGPEHGALGQIVSGSGPTCAFLVADEDAALELAVALSSSGLCRSVRRAAGPVAGATVLR